jgi:dTDP-4-amino-4,6-dideoxygalactose transaminase
MFPVKYSSPLITQDDKDAVLAALDSDWIAGDGPIVREFEQALCNYTGYRYAITTCNATVALDAVYTILRPTRAPVMSFVATANRHEKIKLIDSVNDRQVIDDPEIADIGVSMAGYPCLNMPIVDDAHYLHRGMAHMKGKAHQASVLSFHAIKPITCGEGGAILTNDCDLYEQCRAIVNHGKNAYRAMPVRGYLNYRMPSINAALGLSQLKRHDWMLRHRRSIASYYSTELKAALFSLPEWHEYHSWHLYQIKFNSGKTRDEFKERLFYKGILTQKHYQPIVPLKDDYPNAYNHWRTTLSLPMHNALTEEQVKYVVQQCNKITRDLHWENYK